MATPQKKESRPQGGRVVFPGAEKHVGALVVRFAAQHKDLGLVTLLTQNALIVGKPAGETAILPGAIEASEDSYRRAFKDQGLAPPITGGVVCLLKAQVRPLAAMNNTINFDELAVFSEEIVAIAPGSNFTMSQNPA